MPRSIDAATTLPAIIAMIAAITSGMFRADVLRKYATIAPMVTISPCAKLISRVVPNTKDSPTAVIAMITPYCNPSTTRWNARVAKLSSESSVDSSESGASGDVDPSESLSCWALEAMSGKSTVRVEPAVTETSVSSSPPSVRSWTAGGSVAVSITTVYVPGFWSGTFHVPLRAVRALPTGPSSFSTVMVTPRTGLPFGPVRVSSIDSPCGLADAVAAAGADNTARTVTTIANDMRRAATETERLPSNNKEAGMHRHEPTRARCLDRMPSQFAGLP